MSQITDEQVKAQFLAKLAGVDDVAYFAEKATKSTWEELAKTALSALVATRAEVDELYASSTRPETAGLGHQGEAVALDIKP